MKIRLATAALSALQTLSISFAVSALAFISNLAFAQNSNEDEDAALVEEVVIGTRIAREDFVAASPIVTANVQGMTRQGFTALDDFLRRLPQFRPGLGDFSNTSSGGTIGQSTLNLRGLGPQRNLVLIDGRRLQSSSGNGAIDLNTIPFFAIGDAEVITGGASATYGSDAVAGAINLRTRNLEGLEFAAQYRARNERADESTKFGAVAFGSNFAGGRGSLLVTAEYFDRSGVAVLDRGFFAKPTPSNFIPYVRATPALGASPDAINGILTGHGAGPAPSMFLGINDDGTLFASGAGAQSNFTGATDAPFIAGSDGAFGYHGTYYNHLRTPLERYAYFGKAEYEFHAAATAYVQLQLASTEAQNIGSEPILAGPWGISIPVTNPHFVANSDWQEVLASRTGNPNAPVEVHYRASDAGPRTYNTENDLRQLLFGVKGGNAEETLNWDVYLSFSKAKNTDSTSAGAVSVSAFQALVDAPDGGESICTGGFAVFGSKPLSSDCLDYVSRRPTNTTTLKQTIIEAVLEGPLIDIFTGEVRFALIGNYRKNTYRFNPDADVAANDLASLSAAQPTNGKIGVYELAGELFVPLILNLNATLGYRFSDYNIVGSAETYKAEIDWRPIDILTLRGGFQRALRAPNVDEFFSAGTQQVSAVGLPPGAGDPCDARHPAQVNPDVQALCIATGLDPSRVGQHQLPAASTVTTTVGNRDLEFESADTLTAGFVLDVPLGDSPLGGMRLSIDYYEMEVEDAIFVVDAPQTLAKCYNLDGSNPSYDANNFFCQQIDRSPSGLFNSINQPYLNLGGFKTSGIDLAFELTMPMGEEGDMVQLASYANYLLDFEIATLADDAFQDYAGTISPQFSYPQWQLLTSLTFEKGPMSATVQWRLIPSMDDISSVANAASTVKGTSLVNYLDFSGSLTLAQRYRLNIGATNLINKKPPVVSGAPAVTNLGVYDAIGRTYFISAQIRI